MTFDVIFKAWTAQITEHVKQITEDLRNAEDKISSKSSECQSKVNDLDVRVQALREEFVIFKAEQNTRMKILSAVIATAVLLSTLLVNFDKIRNIFVNDGKKDAIELIK